MTARLQQPVEFVYGNLLVTPKGDGKLSRRRAWAGYELAPTPYDFAAVDRATAYHTSLTRLFRELADVAEVHMAMIPEQIDAAAAQAALLRRVDGEAAEYCRQVAQALAEMQAEADDVCRYRFILWVQLETPPLISVSDVRRVKGATDVRRLLATVNLGQGIPELHLDAWSRSERAMRERLAGFGGTLNLQIRPLTRPECLQLCRAALWQGLPQPQLSDGWAPDAMVHRARRGGVVLDPDGAAMRRLYAGVVDHTEAGRLRVTHTVDGEARHVYHAYLTVEQYSVNPLPLIGGEWAYQLQACGSVSLHLRWTYRSYEATLADIASQKRRQSDTAEQEIMHADGESSDTLQSRDEAEELEAYVRETRSPSLMAYIVIGVTAPTPELLTERIRLVTAVFDRLDIRVTHNAADQVRHLYEVMPGARRLVDDYTHRLLPPGLATCMMGATDELLDPAGTFIAISDGGRPLWFDWLRALARLDKSGSMAFVGPMGTGKSTAANFLAFLCALFGAKALAIDSAKPERSEWPERLPYLGAQTRVVTLSNHEGDRGKLDPYVIFSDRAEATNHAVSQAAFLTQTKLHEPGYDVLLKAFSTVRDTCARPCMLAGIAALEQLGNDPSYKYRSEAERLAERLSSMATMAYANLLFGDGQSAGIDTSGRITVLQLDRIRRPPEGKLVEDYDMDEYLGHAILVATVAFAGAFAAQDRRQQKIILADEIRWFVNNQYGRDLIERQTLTGRAMGAQVLLVGQNVSHLPPDLHQHFSVRWAFGADSEHEAEATLEFLGVDVTPENVERLMSLNPGHVKGQCLVRDLTGRVGQAQICLLFEDLQEAFKTRSLEERVS